MSDETLTARPTVPESSASIGAIYRDKPESYFANARHDIARMLQTGPEASILELGCGAGGTGGAVLQAGKAGRYVGIELSPTAAAAASRRLTDVLIGDVQELDLTALEGSFDALVISEVLEHLTDPWTTLSRLRQCLRPGGYVYASSPNVAHWKVIRGLLRGRFQYEEKGVMDQTHLRWFTPASYEGLFRTSGFDVLEVRPIAPLRPKARMLNWLSGGRLRHLFMNQIMLVGRRPD
jgi:SAM-dependent methyltransferase